MAVRFPFNKICCTRVGSHSRPVLFAASGDSVQALDLTTGTSLCQWPHDEGIGFSEDDDVGVEEVEDDGARPSKRRRSNDGEASSLSRQQSEQSEPSITISTEGRQRQKGERRRPKIPDTTLPNVTHLLVTKDGKHLIVVTAEDKAIKVLEISKQGRLRQISSRNMPKRVCAITLDVNENTILSGDKFGDVYAIPLHPSDDYAPKAKAPVQTESDKFQPSANELTVHTKGNLEALKQQQKQKLQPKTKEGPTFEHKIVTGHISLLTDVTVATGLVDDRKRPFILTADRDEHIRVSRGIPQAYLIEAQCDGAKEFVSKMCILPWSPEVLVAGNGEPSLRVYDWQNGKLKDVINLTELLSAKDEILLRGERSKDKLAVSLVKALDLDENIKLILVALEGLPIVFSFINDGFTLRDRGYLEFGGNILDVAQVPGKSQIVVSIDGVHEKCSMRTLRPEENVNENTLEVLEAIAVAGTEGDDLEVQWQKLGPRLESLQVKKELGKPEKEVADGEPPRKPNDKPYSALGEYLYGLENLRKRRDFAAGIEDDEDEGGVEIHADITAEKDAVITAEKDAVVVDEEPDAVVVDAAETDAGVLDSAETDFVMVEATEGDAELKKR